MTLFDLTEIRNTTEYQLVIHTFQQGWAIRRVLWWNTNTRGWYWYSIGFSQKKSIPNTGPIPNVFFEMNQKQKRTRQNILPRTHTKRKTITK